MKPIIFSTPMVQAILDGRKTQTRRVIKDVKLPRYAAGDILWVRETWRLVDFEYIDDQWSASVQFKDGSLGNRLFWGEEGADQRLGWRPSIHMPKEAARIFLRVTNVRVERLQAITAHDAIREGMESEIPFDAVDKFKELWDSINAKRGYGWETNPWVWVYEFEKINKE